MGMNQNFYTAKELSELWGVSVRMISNYCTEGELPGAEKIGNMWIVPKTVKKPIDGRSKEARLAKK